jgi:hypothetical protein
MLICFFLGVSMNEVKLEQAECDIDERVFWFGLSCFPFSLQSYISKHLIYLLILLMQQ